jgi:hypothetical protein
MQIKGQTDTGAASASDASVTRCVDAFSEHFCPVLLSRAALLKCRHKVGDEGLASSVLIITSPTRNGNEELLLLQMPVAKNTQARPRPCSLGDFS